VAVRSSVSPAASESRVYRPRPAVVVIVVTAAVALAIGFVSCCSPAPAVDHSAYGYSVAVGTNATLTNATFVVPLPTAADGGSPVADSFRAGNASVPEGWRYEIVEREGDLALRLETDEMVAERQPDGRRDGTSLLGTTVRTPTVVDTAEPFGAEPTVAPTETLRERPCPNQAVPDPDQTCFAYDAQVYAAYDAPEDALVSVRLVHNGVNTYEDRSHEMYYERISTVFHGPQEGWTTVVGFASTERRP